MSNRSVPTRVKAVVRWVRITVAAATAVALATVAGPVLPAHAESQRQITLNAPWANAEISGTTEIIFSVSDVGGPVLAGATVSIGGVSASQSVDPNWCQIACAISSILDVGDMPDGPATIEVVLTLVDGTQESAKFSTVVRNGPSVTPIYPLEGGLVAADQVADVRVFVEAQDEATIKAVRWTDRRGRIDFAPFDDPKDLSRPNWQALVPAGDLPEGPFTGAIVATDSEGRESVAVSATFVVIRSIQLEPVIPWREAVDDLALQQLDLRYRYSAAVKDAYPVSAVVRVDGVEATRDPLLERRDISNSDNAGIARLETSYRLPEGSHDVVVEVTDNRGLKRALSYSVAVGPTVTARWTRGAGGSVTSGELHRLTARVVVSSVKVLDCRILTDERRNLPALCTRQADGTWVADAQFLLTALGSHEVQLQVTPSRGEPFLLPTTVTVLPRVTAAVTEASAVAGRRFTLVGEVRSNGPDLGGVVVDLQTRTSANSVWKTVATGTSGATVSGVGSIVKIPVTLARSADVRLVPRPKSGAWGSVPGHAKYVKVGSTLTVTSKPASVKKGRSVTVRGSTRPSDAGALVSLDRYRSSDKKWITVASGRTTSGGVAALRFKPSATATYRLTRAASTTAWGSTSASFSVKVKR